MQPAAETPVADVPLYGFFKLDGRWYMKTANVGNGQQVLALTVTQTGFGPEATWAGDHSSKRAVGVKLVITAPPEPAP